MWLAVPCSEQNNSKRAMARFLISIPKKRVRHAVDRVLLRRRAREAYRLNRDLLYPVAQEHGVTVLIGFNWIANHHYSYSTIERSMQELLRKISTAIAGEKSAIEK